MVNLRDLDRAIKKSAVGREGKKRRREEEARSCY